MEFDAYLPKWPALHVVGQRVTAEQAGEILIRTAYWPPYSNDKRWVRQILDCADIKYKVQEHGYIDVDWNFLDAFREEYKVLNLEYLVNSQITSAYVGGPHGWCNWQGDIGCNDYNIGKWPSVQSVHEEWTRIAEAWPFLDLQCRLYDREQCEDGGLPVVEYLVKVGKCTMQAPTGNMTPAPARTITVADMAFLRPGGEQGCSEAALRLALQQVKKSLAPTMWDKVQED